MSTAAGGGRRARRRRRNVPGLLIAVAALLALAMVLDVVVPAPDVPAAARVDQEPAAAGVWYCPAVAGEGGTGVLHVAAVGEEASQFVVDRYRAARVRADEPQTLEPGGEQVLKLDGRDATAPVAVRWTGGPVAVTWRKVGKDDRAAAAPCEPRPSPHWYIPGFSTTLGSTAHVHVFNPFRSDAVVRLLFATPDGPVALVIADNLLVGAGGTTTVNLGRYRPEEPDLGVIVEVLAGRVVAQGELNVTPPRRTSGSAGRVLLPAAPAPSMSWAFATATDDDDSDSWLSVLNPGDDVAAVEVRVSNPAGGGSSLLGEVSVPAGGLSRIELASASEKPEFGVSLVVTNGQPVVATRLTSRPHGGKQVLFGGAGASELSTTWALLGSGSQGNTGLVSVFNPGPEATSVDVVAPGAPRSWAGIEIGPNRRVSVDLTESRQPAGSLPVVVRAQGPVVADLRSSVATAVFRGWQTTGAGAAQWIGATSRPPVHRDPQLATDVRPPPEEVDNPLSGFQGLESISEPTGG
ncbi:MAG: hypothetical protein GEU74_04395 [Nitriliruptorales bacterium]|nr:hypothetical protein [Nitriliruptorales bacterium]